MVTLSDWSLLPLKARNWWLDSIYYDVGSLDFSIARGESEWETTTRPETNQKGTIIVVPPRSAKRENTIRPYNNPHRFMASLDTVHKNIRAIVIAGVGSTALGTAALARNVADYMDCEVAGIVSGYGLSDVLMEGMGGWFYYGGIDRLRYKLDRLVERVSCRELSPREDSSKRFDDRPKGVMGLGFDRLFDKLDELRYSVRWLDLWTRFALFLAGCTAAFGGVGAGYPMGSFDVLGNSDVRTLHDILSAGRERLKNLDLLVGHSKGNLLISFVLNHIKDELENRKWDFEHLKVVTLGAVVDLPTEALVLNTHQFLGQLDPIGHFNSEHDSFNLFSRIPIPYEEIPGVRHHLNPLIGCHMSVAEVLKKAGVAGRDGGPSGVTLQTRPATTKMDGSVTMTN